MPSALTPDFEVKVLLDASKVLGQKNKLKDEVLSAFGIDKGPKKMSIQFVDDENQTIYKAGWNLRVRTAEGDDNFEMTYKKRYPINSTLGINEDPIGKAVTAANNDGFNSDEAFSAQVEVGYQQQTLSIGLDEPASSTGYEELDLPDENVSRGFLVDKMPLKLRNWSAENWGIDSLSNPVVYGPVHAKRYKSTWQGLKLSVEVWPIRKSKTDPTLVPVVEASFKATEAKAAFEGQAKLTEFVRGQGWFLVEDSLKTKLIMDRYGKGS